MKMNKNVIAIIAALVVIGVGFSIAINSPNNGVKHEGYQARAWRAELTLLKKSGLCGDHKFAEHPIGATMEMEAELSFLQKYEVCLKHKRFTLEATQ